MINLDNLRIEIDDIDKQLVELFEKRMDIVEKVANYKYKNGLEILNKQRENQVVEKNLNKLDNEEYEDYLKEFFFDLMKVSRSYQNNKIVEWDKKIKQDIFISEDKNEQGILKEDTINVVYQGVPGSFSYEALEGFFSDEINEEKINRINVPSFKKVFEAVKIEEARYGVLPIENSSTGAISEVYDFLRENDLFIVGEVKVKVEHNLLGLKGSRIEDIKEVYSHPQALEQSKEFLSQYSSFKAIPYINTATSAKWIKEQGDITKACVSSIKAMEIYDLDLLKAKTNYNENNYTRFIIISSNNNINTACNKISTVLSVAHETGALHNVLTIFKKYNLNMMKIESRPIIGKPWEYFFYIDFEGNMKDENVSKLISEIKKGTNFFKLLGNYKAC